MRAVQITELTGPGTATALVEVPEPEPSHPLTPGEAVVIEVRAAGVSFPEVLQTRGLYQVKPELPFIPGSEVAGVVRGAPAGASVAPGDRVAAFVMQGAFAEVAVAPVGFTFPLPDGLDFRQGAGLILNYHTAYFALATRGRVKVGETVLVHGAAGGIGTAAVQVAKGLGARVVAVVSSDIKEVAARGAGADLVLRSADAWKDQARELGGIDVVLDPVGGDRFTDSLRSLRPGGRVVVVGFTGGSIPEIRVNRLLLGNTEVVGAGWGTQLLGGWDTDREASLQFLRHTESALAEMIAAGHVWPVIGASFPLERAADSLKLIESREATGKIVLDI